MKLKSILFLIAISIISVSPNASSMTSPNEYWSVIDEVQIGPEFTLRRMVIPNPNAKATVLLLHGFPETIYTWKQAAQLLAKDYEVHAFDWPGFGQSTRPTADKFSYAPMDFANVLRRYIKVAKLNSNKLIIYATDIGSLPALLLALEEPLIAKKIIVGDFAPFNRQQYMYKTLKDLKIPVSADRTRKYMNTNKDAIIENAFKNGLTKEEQFELPEEFKEDMIKSWSKPPITTADAFYNYYSHFTRDQNYFEKNISRLRTPVKIIWGDKDFYINKLMGIELAKKLNTKIDLLPNVSHYPHLQDPKHVYDAVNSR